MTKLKLRNVLSPFPALIYDARTSSTIQKLLVVENDEEFLNDKRQKIIISQSLKVIYGKRGIGFYIFVNNLLIFFPRVAVELTITNL
jgi:hypothetical protein